MVGSSSMLPDGKTHACAETTESGIRNQITVAANEAREKTLSQCPENQKQHIIQHLQYDQQVQQKLLLHEHQERAKINGNGNNIYLEKMRKAQNHLSKERFVALANARMMLQHEVRQRNAEQQLALTAANMQQKAAFLQIMSGERGLGHPTPQPSVRNGIRNNANVLLNAEYLQQLQIEAMVNHRRQSKLTQNGLRFQVLNSNATTNPNAITKVAANGAVASLKSPPVVNPSKQIVADKFIQKAILMARADEEFEKEQKEEQVQQQIAADKFKRQDMALQKAILMARVEEELQKEQQKERIQQHGQQRREQDERSRQAASVKPVLSFNNTGDLSATEGNIMKNNDNITAMLRALRSGAGVSDDSKKTVAAITSALSIISSLNVQKCPLVDLQKQLLYFAKQHKHQQQNQSCPAQAMTPSSISSLPPPVQLELYHRLLAQQQQGFTNATSKSSGARADLTSSVFGKVVRTLHGANNNNSNISTNSNTESNSKSISMNKNTLKQAPTTSSPTSNSIVAVETKGPDPKPSTVSARSMILSAVTAAKDHQFLNTPQVQQQQEQVMTGNLSQQEAERKSSFDCDASFHDSTSIILPCRARGMPMDHNAKSAYFVIPENIKHGTDLICSHFGCRNAGIKFRYCSYCKLSAAKRNFSKRHRHSGKIVEVDDPKEENSNCHTISSCSSDSKNAMNTTTHTICTTVKPTSNTEEKRFGLSPNPPKMKMALGETPLSASSSSSSLASTSKSASASLSASATASATPSATISTTVGAKIEASTAPISSSTKTPTSSLTTSPKRTMPFSSNITVDRTNENDPHVSENISGAEEFRPITKRRRQAWKDLLLSRPKSHQDNSQFMIEWIQDVLRVSDLENNSFGGESGDKKRRNPSPNPDMHRDEMPHGDQKCSKKPKMGEVMHKIKQEERKANPNTPKPFSVEESNHSSVGIKDILPEDNSTSSEDSVDLRVRKKVCSK